MLTARALGGRSGTELPGSTRRRRGPHLRSAASAPRRTAPPSRRPGPAAAPRLSRPGSGASGPSPRLPARNAGKRVRTRRKRRLQPANQNRLQPTPAPPRPAGVCRSQSARHSTARRSFSGGGGGPQHRWGGGTRSRRSLGGALAGPAGWAGPSGERRAAHVPSAISPAGAQGGGHLRSLPSPDPCQQGVLVGGQFPMSHSAGNCGLMTPLL